MERCIEDRALSKSNLSHQRPPGVSGARSRLDQDLTLAFIENRPAAHVEVDGGHASSDLAQLIVHDVRGDHTGIARPAKPEHARESRGNQAAGEVRCVRHPPAWTKPCKPVWSKWSL